VEVYKLNNMKKFLFKLACKLLGYKEVYSYKTGINSTFVVSEKPLSKKQLKEIDRSITNGEEIHLYQSVYGGDLSGVLTGEVVDFPIKKSLIELATKRKKESGIVKEGALILEEK
jgi:hypothetical protein